MTISGAIQDNPTLRHFPAWENFVPPHANPISRRPVVNLTLAINYAIGGLDVRGFHAGNLLIHLLTALVLFGIVRRTLLAPSLREQFGGAASGLALAVALIWAVHPLLTESVTYLTQRTELLMGLFFLLTLYGAIRGASSGHPWRWYAAAIAACALGMGAKEVMATAPIVVLLYDRCFLSGSFREAFRRRCAFYLGLAATWAILGALLIAYPVGRGDRRRVRPGGGRAVGIRAHAAGRHSELPAAELLAEFAVPGLRLADRDERRADHPARRPSSRRCWPRPCGRCAGARRSGFSARGSFLILAPSSSFVPIVTEVAAERRMYLPLAAVVTGASLRLIGSAADGSAAWPIPPGRRNSSGRAWRRWRCSRPRRRWAG